MEFATRPILLVSDIGAEGASPQLTFMTKRSRLLAVDLFLSFIPCIEVLFHMQ